MTTPAEQASERAIIEAATPGPFAAAYLADFARKAKANKPKKRRKTHDDA
jgi:hypothetical protein